MSTRSIVVAICAVLLLGVAAAQAPGKKHKHAVKMVYTSVPIFTPPGDVWEWCGFLPRRLGRDRGRDGVCRRHRDR